MKLLRNFKEKKLYILVLLFLAFILIRTFGLNIPFYADETRWAVVTEMPFSDYMNLIPHPPISILLYKSISMLLGLSTFSIRLFSLIFGFLSLIMVYFIAKNNFGEKTALYSMIIMVSSFWSVLASLQVDIDGSLLMFIFTLYIYYFIEYVKTKDKKILYYLGIILGFGLLTKSTSILLVMISGLYYLAKEKNLKIVIPPFAIISVIGGAIYMSTISLMYSIWPTFVTRGNIIFHILDNISKSFSLLELVYFVIWGTSLFLGILIISIIDKDEKYSIFKFWIFITILTYFFIGVPYIAVFDRYLMIIIPPLSIIGGEILKKIRFSAKDGVIIGIVAALSALIFVSLNLHNEYITHNIKNYVSRMLTFNWNFFFPITGGSGPQFGVSFSSIMISIIISMSLIGIYIIGKALDKKRLAHYSLICFFSVSFTFNLFLVSEYLIHPMHPNYDDGVRKIIEYANTHDIKLPVYSNEVSIAFYLNLTKNMSFHEEGDEKTFIFNYAEVNDIRRMEKMNSSIKLNGGTVLIVDYPILDKESMMWKSILKQCNEKERIYSKKIITGYVFEC